MQIELNRVGIKQKISRQTFNLLNGALSPRKLELLHFHARTGLVSLMLTKAKGVKHFIHLIEQ